MGKLVERVAGGTAAVVLLLMGALAGGAALRESMTVDEPAHLGAGVSYLQRLDMRMNVEHPPLAKVLAGLPLVLRGVHADYQGFSWNFAETPFAAYLAQWPFGHRLVTRWNDAATTLAWARLPMLLLTLGLGALIYACGSRLGGPAGGLRATCLYASLPVFLAFGPLVLTDVAVTFFALLTAWAFADMWAASGSGRAVLRFGLALAGALLSKFSAGILLFAFLAFQLSLRWWPPALAPKVRDEARAWRHGGGRDTVEGILWAVLFVYAFYSLFTLRQPTTTLAFLGQGPASLVLRRLLMPAWTYLMGLLFFAMVSVRPTFVLGHTYSHGVPFYFPVAFLLKTPLPSLALWLLAVPVVLLARRRPCRGAPIIPPGRELHWRVVWVFLAVFGAFCLLSQMDISIRHFMIPIVLLILLVAPLPRALVRLTDRGWRPARALGWLTAALVVLSLATAVRAYPFYIPFLNSLAMGREGYTLLNDSNLDWCQSFPEVRRFAEERKIERVLLDEYGFAEPTVEIPQARLWSCQKPAPDDAGQWAVVSAGMILDGHNCGWLLGHPHEPLAGGALYAFRLPDPIPAAGAPGGPPRLDELRNWTGAPMDFRTMLYRSVRDPREMKAVMEQIQREFEAQRRK